MNYIKNDKYFQVICLNNKIKNNTILHNNIIKDIVNGDKNILEPVFNEWILTNVPLIINNLNSENYIDIDKVLSSTSYLFLRNMLYMNKNLEFNKSKKHYQIIPIRTNLRPKFIPINTHSLIDIIDSKYLDNNKNHYHNNTLNGISEWNKFFSFKSKYILNSIKKGYEFSGLIQTNGYEIVFIYFSKEHMKFKNKFHLAGREEKNKIKNHLKDIPENEKKDAKLLYDKNKKENKMKKDEDKEELFKIEKDKEINEQQNILNEINVEINDCTKKYKDKCINIEKEYINIIKNCKETEIETNKYKTSLSYITHCYNRDKLTLINDYKNNIDDSYNTIFLKDNELNDEINVIKETIKSLKKLVKKYKNKKKKNKTKFKIVNKIKLVRHINKIREKINLLNYECDDTKYHITEIKKNLCFILEDMKKNELYKELLKDCTINYNDTTTNIKNIFNDILLLLITEVQKDKYKKFDCEKNDYVGIENIISNFNIEYYNIIDKMTNENKKLCEKINIQKNNNINLKEIFKNRHNEYLKIDLMSKKYLNILEKMNWCVIDPGINSLFNILSKDGKKKYNYTKKLHNNRMSLHRNQKNMLQFKKKEIQGIEDGICKDENRLKTSNVYNIFKEYYKKKMDIHDKLETLYNDEKLNKLKWNLYINEKRAQNMLINDIKRIFNKDVVLILGDWSMDKSVIKGISPTPNKKYTRILEKNFITLKINEYRTSIIHNKYEVKCENYSKEYNAKYEKIKKVFLLEELKKKEAKEDFKEEDKKYEKIKKKIKLKYEKIHKILVCKTNEELNEYQYVDRDNNATKNMVKIVNSYLTTNYRPINFIMGTKACMQNDQISQINTVSKAG